MITIFYLIIKILGQEIEIKKYGIRQHPHVEIL